MKLPEKSKLIYSSAWACLYFTLNSRTYGEWKQGVLHLGATPLVTKPRKRPTGLALPKHPSPLLSLPSTLGVTIPRGRPWEPLSVLPRTMCQLHIRNGLL